MLLFISGDIILLDKKSKALFNALYADLLVGKRLFSLNEISKTINENQIDKIKSSLFEMQREGLLDVIFADKRGDLYAYILLQKKGIELFNRKKREKRELLLRVFFAFISAFVTFVLSKLFFKIFS